MCEWSWINVLFLISSGFIFKINLEDDDNIKWLNIKGNSCMYENKYVPEIIAEKIFAYYQEGGFDPLFEEGPESNSGSCFLKDIIALSKGQQIRC